MDPPLHEFLPRHEELAVELAHLQDAGAPPRAIAEIEAQMERVSSLAETNPMIGTRGCRLGIMYPEIYEMQVRAIVGAAVAVRARTGQQPEVEIMIPLVDYERELELIRGLVDRSAQEAIGDAEPISYKTGTMVELPRACLVADRIARSADFFSFGTNDLTQTALGFSRDDVEKSFIERYVDLRVVDRSPFETLDVPGVGALVRTAAELGRAANPAIKLGICGEHGGDPDSIRFFSSVGLDYVSCSPYRVPIARIAAAQAALADS
jgi:pyruvate,orthophosphate dikinase